MNFVQTFVAVSVDRKVPLQEASREMLKAAFRHPFVLKSPAPVVLLREVDSYWLTFEVHFCVEHFSFMRCAIVQSEILGMIADIVKPMEAAVTAESEGAAQSAEPEKLAESATTGPTVEPRDAGETEEAAALVERTKNQTAVETELPKETNGVNSRSPMLTPDQAILANLTKINAASLRKHVNGTRGSRRLGA